jgi:hypothetical protein
MVFKKGGKLKATVRWGMTGQNNEEVDKFNHLGLTLESTGGLNKNKARTKGHQALVGQYM